MLPRHSTAKLALVLLFGAGFLVLHERSRPEVLERRHPLPGTMEIADRLHQEGLSGPAGLLDEILVWVTPRELGQKELAERTEGRPEPDHGAELDSWEEELSLRLRDLSPEERALLWSMTVEPSFPEDLSSRVLRLLDRGSPSSADLRRALRGPKRGPAWEAAIRLGRRGLSQDLPALREAVRNWRGWGRQYAILGLVFMDDVEGLPELREAAEDDSPSVRRHVAMALAELGELEDLRLLDEIARRNPDRMTLKTVLISKKRLLERRRPLP